MKTSEIRSALFKKIDGLNGNQLQEVYGLFLNYINNNKSRDGWVEISEAEKASIKEGIAQLDRGEGIPHKEVIAKYRKKYDV